VNIANPTVPSTANLTSEGTLDWVSFANDPVFRKASPAATITNLPSAGTLSSSLFYPCTFAWTDEKNGNAPPAAPQKYQYFGSGEVAFDAPATTTTRTLSLYVSTYAGDAILTATLTDGAKATSSTFVNQQASIAASFYVVTFIALSTSSTLHVSWKISTATVSATTPTASIGAVALR
jgi:hypothetical protein